MPSGNLPQEVFTLEVSCNGLNKKKSLDFLHFVVLLAGF